MPGGAVPAGLAAVAVEWHDDQPVAVPVAHFDFDSFDSLKEIVLEVLAEGGDIEPILRSWMKREAFELKREGMVLALSELITSEKPGQAAAQLAFATGLDVTLGLSGVDLAKKNGIRKQAFFQGVERFRARFFGRLIRLNQRDAEARQKMRLRNYRHPRAAAQSGRAGA